MDATKEMAAMQSKLEQKLKGAQKVAIQSFDDIAHLNDNMSDFIATVGTQDQRTNVSYKANGVVNMSIRNMGDYTLHPNAIVQAGSKYGVPTKYLKSLIDGKADWQRQLAANILNEHNNHYSKSRVLVRSVENEVRGLLSDRYRRLDSPTIITAFLQSAKRQGAVVVDAHVSDLKVFFEVIVPQIIPVETPNNGTVYMVAGAQISNSDFGAGSLQVKVFTMNMICLNGMTRENKLRQVHLGSKLSDNVHFSDKTYRLDTKTTASAVSDIMGNVLSTESIKAEMLAIQASSSKEVDLEKELKVLPKKGLLKSEVESVKKELFNNDPEHGVQGKNSLWKLSQAITYVGNESETKERKRELDDLAGQLLINK